MSGYCLISGAATSGVKVYNAAGIADMQASGQANSEGFVVGGIIDTSASITEINIISSTGSFDAGTVFVYTSA